MSRHIQRCCRTRVSLQLQQGFSIGILHRDCSDERAVRAVEDEGEAAGVDQEDEARQVRGEVRLREMKQISR